MSAGYLLNVQIGSLFIIYITSIKWMAAIVGSSSRNQQRDHETRWRETVPLLTSRAVTGKFGSQSDGSKP